MTKRERYLRALRNQAVDELVWAPNFDYWLRVNTAEQTLPEKYRGLSRNDIVRAVGGYIWNRSSGHRTVIDKSVTQKWTDLGEKTVHELRGGTVKYAAPERFSEHFKSTAASDIYSLGVVFYEVLTGRDGLEIFQVASSEEIFRPEDPINRKLREICLRCVQRKPEDRYQTAEDLHLDLIYYNADVPQISDYPYLCLLDRELSGKLLFPLTKRKYYIGRSLGNDLTIQHPEVSRVHALIQVEGSQVFLENFSKINPVKVSGNALAYREVKALSPHEQVEIAEYVLFYVPSNQKLDNAGEPGASTSVTPQKQEGDFTLTVQVGTDVLGRYECRQDIVTIGSSRECNVPIEDLQASPLHAQVERRGKQFFLVDLQSFYGTFVQGKKIREWPFNDKDVFCIGQHTLIFEPRTSYTLTMGIIKRSERKKTQSAEG
jgi:pSer/pThr/pTyr-binding forkhead associated (FHA) protein